jgi:hypothetical protein
MTIVISLFTMLTEISKDTEKSNNQQSETGFYFGNTRMILSRHKFPLLIKPEHQALASVSPAQSGCLQSETL